MGTTARVDEVITGLVLRVVEGRGLRELGVVGGSRVEVCVVGRVLQDSDRVLVL